MASSTTENKPKSIKLTYFDLEGSAEPIRLVLALAGVEYTDERVKYADWSALKPNTPYGQLPMVQLDTDPKLRAQSGAIMRYMATTFAPEMLYPPQSLMDIEEVIGLATDMANSMAPMIYINNMYPEKYGYAADFASTDEGKAVVKKLRETWLHNEFPNFCKHLERWLDETNETWIASSGDMPTLADCVVVPLLRRLTRGFIDHIPASALDDHPKLVAYVKRFCALPQIKGRYTDGLY